MSNHNKSSADKWILDKKQLNYVSPAPPDYWDRHWAYERARQQAKWDSDQKRINDLASFIFQ